MKRLAFGLTTAVLAAFFLAGCGGDDADDAGDGETLTLQSYFDQVSELLEIYEGGNEAAFTVLNESDDLDELKSAFNVLPGTLEDFVTNFDALAAPAEAEAAASDVVEAGEAFLAELTEVNEEAQAAETVDEFVQLADNEELVELSAAFSATCPPMQDIASDGGVEDELFCPQ